MYMSKTQECSSLNKMFRMFKTYALYVCLASFLYNWFFFVGFCAWWSAQTRYHNRVAKYVTLLRFPSLIVSTTGCDANNAYLTYPLCNSSPKKRNAYCMIWTDQAKHKLHTYSVIPKSGRVKCGCCWTQSLRAWIAAMRSDGISLSSSRAFFKDASSKVHTYFELIFWKCFYWNSWIVWNIQIYPSLIEWRIALIKHNMQENMPTSQKPQPFK